MKTKNKKIVIIFFVLILIIISFFVYKRFASADVAQNKVAIKNISLTSIETGISDFDNSDGLDYSNSANYSSVTGYIPGNDNNSKNRIVRSFDELSYNFNYEIMDKNGNDDYEERTVNIKVTLPEDVSKYVTFDKDSAPGETSHIYSFNGVDTYGSFDAKVTLYVLGAPNGMKISPKFEIQESTNTDENYIVNLGSITFDTEKYNYEYNSENANKYSMVSTINGFLNYMPTVVSSKSGDFSLELLTQESEGQKATYNNNLGRYLTYVFGYKINGNNSKGIKGLSMPNGNDITFDVNVNQNGSSKVVSMEETWGRLYGKDNLSEIESVIVNEPYSTSQVDNSKLVKNVGNVKLSKKTDDLFNGIINGYKVTYNSATVSAKGSNIGKNEHYLGTYALTVFSPRTVNDGKNDITTSLSISNFKIQDTNGSLITLPTISKNLVNKYYEEIDYSLTGEFYNGSSKVSKDTNGTGAVSKGTNLIYKTTFNYKKTMSDQGLKEVIKIDPNALRLTDDIKINIEGVSDKKISQDDFEITYVTGDFNNSNYVSETKSNISDEDLSIVKSSCANIQKNINNYSSDQIMNLYGGPCIKAKSGVEQTFKKVSEAKDKENIEIPITKIIVQTKKGIKLPDNIKVTIDANVRVRDVSDITRTYQATSLASSSDYDAKISYFAPRVTNDENSITNPNNYKKTTYNGNNIASIDTDSPWGDTLKIVNFTSREEVTVTNKNNDGTLKNRFNANNGETIYYNIKTTITDDSMNSGADDTWYINYLSVRVKVPNGLVYVPDKDLGTPEVTSDPDNTYLMYKLPYTKPNMKIKDINFKATISPTLKGSSIPLTVESRVEAINVNGETDTSYFGYLTGSYTIYATGIENVIVSQKIGDKGSKLEKNSEFNYLLSIYNNTNNNIKDYAIMDILPSNGDKNGSEFNGTYKVKLELPSTLGNVKVYCSNSEYNKLSNEVFDEKNEFKECNALNEYVDATAIKIINISVNANSYADDIKLWIKPKDNNYSNKYINSYVGASKTYAQNESNKIEARVISRNISGRVFIDNNENGVEDIGDTYYSDMPVTLYKLDSENNMTELETTVTDKDGKYIFKNLNVGRYKIRANFDNSVYDLTLRYASENTAIDSDGYKVSDNMIEISNKKTPEESDGIKVTREIESVTDMNIGLIPRKTFGFSINKYITKIDLNYNNSNSILTYNNEKKVSLSVKNSLRASAKVYYGIEITNNSSTPGYVKLINEDIPVGLTFNIDDPANKDWFVSNDEIRSVALENDLIMPGEKRYLTIMLNMPTQLEARSFINTVTLLEISSYEPESEATGASTDYNSYSIGEAIRYGGVDFHVINTENSDNNGQILTLLADSGTISTKLGHTTSNNDIYKWSDSLINGFINNEFVNMSTLNLPILYDNSVCDDASGLQAASYGGTLLSEGKCQSNIYKNYKVRLLTETEYNKLISGNNADLSWLYGNSDFWLMNSVYMKQKYDVYGNIIESTNVKNYAKYISKSSSTIKDDIANIKKEIRPVVTVSSKNIIAE